MAYGKRSHTFNFLTSLKIRLARLLVYSFPLNGVRVWGLKRCGFKVGKNVYFGNSLILTMPNAQSDCNLVIGNRVSVAPRVTLILASDSNWSKLNEIIPPKEGKIVLQDDCWIGAGAIILPDITIGEMSVVGAGSVVTKDVPPYTIVAGVPAKEIRKLDR